MLEKKKKKKLSRAERNEDVKNRLFAAAQQLVGELGYAETSIARITAMAGVAQGTFYNHFESRQAMLDTLLPVMGLEMAHFVQHRAEHLPTEGEREIARFKAFFEYLQLNPGFSRILNEAEYASPEAYRQHMRNMAHPFQRLMIKARDREETGDYSDIELQVIVHILMGARSYLSQQYGANCPPDAVFSAYARLLREGLFTPPA